MKYDENYLKQQGFSETGLKRFINTIEEYEEELYKKSIDFGKANQDSDMPLEITTDNVRNAAMKLKTIQAKKKSHPLLIISNVFEYIFTIIITIGASNLNKSWGQIVFGIFITLTAILLIIRLSYRRET